MYGYNWSWEFSLNSILNHARPYTYLRPQSNTGSRAVRRLGRYVFENFAYEENGFFEYESIARRFVRAGREQAKKNRVITQIQTVTRAQKWIIEVVRITAERER